MNPPFLIWRSLGWIGSKTCLLLRDAKPAYAGRVGLCPYGWRTAGELVTEELRESYITPQEFNKSAKNGRDQKGRRRRARWLKAESIKKYPRNSEKTPKASMHQVQGEPKCSQRLGLPGMQNYYQGTRHANEVLVYRNSKNGIPKWKLNNFNLNYTQTVFVL
jgi:hypothetical protein